MQRARERLTYANVMATIAVFIALGGVSYAATQLPRNSVGAKQLKPGAVNSAKVRDRSLLAKDFKPGQLPQSIPGPAGRDGAPGRDGEVGPRGPAGREGGVLASVRTDGEETIDSGPGETTVRQLAIEAPAAGSVLVGISAVTRPASPVTGTCNVEIRAQAPDGAFGESGLSNFGSADSTSIYRSTYAVEVFSVEAGENIFLAQARINPFVSPSCGGEFAIAASMTALWVPTEPSP